MTPSLASRGLGAIGRPVTDLLQLCGEWARLCGRTSMTFVRRPPALRQWIRQLGAVGVGSVGLALFMGTFAGMVLAFQFGQGLERFGAKVYIGQTTVTALVRELGPILTALVVGGRVGAAIAAELGGMVVTEQIDAMRALGADPLRQLIVPRIAAVVIAFPLLVIGVDVVGFLGGMLIARLQYGISPSLFVSGVLSFIQLGDIGSGLIKAAVFALLLVVCACREGMSVSGGSEGVGRAATRAVVLGAVSVLFADLVLTKLMLET